MSLITLSFFTDTHGNHLTHVIEPQDKIGKPEYIQVDLYINGVVETSHTYPYNRPMYEIMLELDEEIQQYL